MSAYYNEIDPNAAQTLRNLIAGGHIAPGDVDTRDIRDVRPDDLKRYTQCHFFAGVGVWSYALRRAGWPDSRRVWTGSCPCQPFSAAGAGLGFADERHLWPYWFWLIEQCAPADVLGEQVASKDANPWLDLVSADLEGLDFAFGALAFPSAGIGAPHIRDRTYFVAHADDARSQGWRGMHERAIERAARSSRLACGLAHHHEHRCASHAVGKLQHAAHHSEPCGGIGGLADTNGCAGQQGGSVDRRRHQGSDAQPRPGSGSGGVPVVLEYAGSESCDRVDGRRSVLGSADANETLRLVDARCDGLELARPSATNGYWRDADWIFCRDGKWRPVEPGTFPLAHGASNRVGRLRGYGNAINAEAACAFIEAADAAIAEYDLL